VTQRYTPTTISYACHARVVKRVVSLALVVSACRARPSSIDEPAPPTPPTPDAAPEGAPPEITFDDNEPEIRGALDAAALRAVIQAAAPELGACHRAHAPEEPVAYEIQFTIRPDGTVDSASAEGAPVALGMCLTEVLLGLRFPQPADGATVHVRYPLP
jgi:hypothetical protein